ncbi:MAG: HpcH/HpaI aldolase/citrate lyase family protein [Pikeienuella sp.]
MSTPRAKLDRLCGPGSVACAWLGLAAPAAARLTALAGLRAAVIDREHGAIGVETAAAMVFAVKAQGAAAFVRVPDRGKGQIQQALDAGADGLVLPQVETAEQAAAAVRLALYPPAGSRGAAAAVIPATGYGTTPGYQSGWNAHALIAAQIESRAGLAAMRDIAAVPGIDMLFFGPFDYSADAGLDVETDASALAEVFAEIRAAASEAGKLSGAFPWPGRRAGELLGEGVDLVAAVSDLVALRAAFAAAAAL